MKRLSEKVIVVTGGTGVLGGAIIKGLAGEGAIVGILGRNSGVAIARAKEIQDNGGKAIALIADVLDEIHLGEAKEAVLKKFGKIDGLINVAGGNTAGAVVAPDSDLFNLDIKSLREVFELNLFGTILPTQIFGKAIADTSKKGSIINISSVSAKSAITKVLGYSLAKAAIETYTKWFAVELANRFGEAIRMNALMPGFFLTEQNKNLLTKEDGNLTERGSKVITKTPFKRFGMPDELSGAVIWLLSDESSFVTGTTIIIDGGFTAFSGV